MKKPVDHNQIRNKIETNYDRINSDDFKTTDINILLNRVRIDKKKQNKKKLYIIFSLILFIFTFISLMKYL
jgi:hypothetical protein